MDRLPDGGIANYDAPRASRYDRVWRRYNERTLSATVGLVDVTALAAIPSRLGRKPRALDVACGTGTLLRTLLTWIPNLRAVGVDASEAMLAQARMNLNDFLATRKPLVQLMSGQVGAGPMANLTLTPGSFDLITCTNALHYLPDPVGALTGLADLLAPDGQCVLEDFAWRAWPFPWPVVEMVIRRIDRPHVRAYTCAQAQALAVLAGWRVVAVETFAIDWLWHGWALRLTRT